jgi:hypothetical protein
MGRHEGEWGHSMFLCVSHIIKPKNMLYNPVHIDKYGPSCLILGFTKTGRPLHIQCSYPRRPLIKIITLYEPDQDLWVDFRFRKQD